MVDFRELFHRNPSLYVIAEVATEHWGELDRAILLIDLAKKSGAHAVKFQHVLPWEIYPPGGGIVCIRGKNLSLEQHFAQVRMTPQFLQTIATHAQHIGIDLLVTAYGVESFNQIAHLPVKMHKIASPELTHPFLLRALQQQSTLTLLSTGVSTWEDILYATSFFSAERICLMQCVTQYPADPREYNLLAAAVMAREGSGCLGVSDHSRDPKLIPGLAYGLAYLLGRPLILEKHMTVCDHRAGIDQEVSLFPQEFLQMTQHLKNIYKKFSNNPACKSILLPNEFLEADCVRIGGILSKINDLPIELVLTILGNGTKTLTVGEQGIYRTTNRSFFATQDLHPGTIITEENTGLFRSEQRGFAGLDYRFVSQLGVAKVTRFIAKGTQLTQDLVTCFSK